MKGDIFIVSFPFSDLTQTKRRPALFITTFQENDLILCQITNQSIGDICAIGVNNRDFNSGGLNQANNIRQNHFLLLISKLLYIRQVRLKVKN